jgi:hypothetical protein
MSSPSSTKQTISPVESFITGFAVGAAEPFASQPLNNVKTALQTKMPIPKTPRLLWSGVMANSVCVSAVTAAQMPAIGGAKNYFSQNGTRELRESEKIASSVFGAFVGSFFTTPPEKVMVRMQEARRHYEEQVLQKQPAIKPTYSGVMRSIYKQEGVFGFGRGWMGCLGRDVPFCIAYDYLSKRFKIIVLPYCPNETVATVVGGVGAGVIGGASGHIFDTWKSNVQMGNKLSVKQVIQLAPKGFLARTGRIGFAVTFFTVGTDELTKLFQKLTI